MFLQIVLLLLGLLMVIGGANYLVDGASSVARKTGISEFVIGLVIVGFGTSLPELVVSVTGAVAHNSDIAVGNVFGSNVFNTSLILAFSAMIAPVAITRQNRFRDIPLTILVTFIVALMGKFGGLSRLDGIVLLALFAGYIIFCFRTDSVESIEAEDASRNISCRDITHKFRQYRYVRLCGSPAQHNTCMDRCLHWKEEYPGPL